MHVAIVTPFLDKGGVGRVVLEIAKRFDADIYTTNYEPADTFEEFQKLNVVLYKSLASYLPLPKRLRDAAVAAKVFSTLKLEGYDVINCHTSPSEFIRFRNSPVIWYCHSPNREVYDLYEWRNSRRALPQRLMFSAATYVYKALDSWVVPSIEHIFTNSRNSQERIRKYLKKEAEVLHPGVNYEKFFNKGYERYFFYPSRISPEKDFEFAIEAFKKFSEKEKGWKLVIGGSLNRQRKEHVEYYEKIKEMLGSHGEVIVDMSESQLLNLYAHCYAVLFTPINEDFGLVPLEGFSAYKPCIAKAEGGPLETIEHGKDGFLAESTDKMAQFMLELAGSENLAKKMGLRGRKKVEKKFNWDILLKRFEEVARSLY
ncbi:MAG: glycosyltransferase family 4 protein [Candidatus Anstonellales archaeon]